MTSDISGLGKSGSFPCSSASVFRTAHWAHLPAAAPVVPWRPGWRNTTQIDIHDMTPYEASLGSDISGIDAYATRALVLGSSVVVVAVQNDHEEIQICDYHAYLKNHGFGPCEVIILRGSHLLEALLSPTNVTQFKRVQELAQNGHRIQLFAHDSKQHELQERLGVEKVVFLTQDNSTGILLDHKLSVRELAKSIYPKDQNPFAPYCTSRGVSETLKAAIEMMQLHKCVFLKNPDMEGGVGMMKINRTLRVGEIHDFCQRHTANREPVLIEAGLVGDAADVSLRYHVEPHEIVAVACTGQYMNGTQHMGNIISLNQGWSVLPEHWPESVRGSIEEQLWKTANPLVQFASANGYVGNFGVDLRVLYFADSQTFKVYVLECNARVTGATYPIDMLEQAAANLGHSNLTVAMYTTKLPKRTSWNKIHNIIEEFGFGYSQGQGIILGPPTLVDRHNKLIIFAVGDNPGNVEVLLQTLLPLFS